MIYCWDLEPRENLSRSSWMLDVVDQWIGIIERFAVGLQEIDLQPAVRG